MRPSPGKLRPWLSGADRPEGSTLVLAGAVWLCLLPLLAFLALPLLGAGVTVILGLAVLALLLAACLILCQPRHRTRERWEEQVREAARRSGTNDPLVMKGARAARPR